MQIDEALMNWDYPNTKKYRKLLELICNTHPELCKGIDPIDIKKGIVKPYLPKHRNKDIFSHIIYAAQEGAHLFPEIFHTDDLHLKMHIKELCKAGLLKKLPKRKKTYTENFAITTKANTWLIKRKSQKIKYITDAIGPVKPDFVINNNISI